MISKRPLIALFTGSISVLGLVNCSSSDSPISENGGSESGGPSGGSALAGAAGKAGAASHGGTSGGAGAPDSQAGNSPGAGAAGKAAGGASGAGTAGGATGGSMPIGEAGEGGSAGTGEEAGAAGSTTEPTGPHQAAILKYNFDEGSGTVAVDASGNGHNGKLSIAGWTAQGRNGAGLSLNGGSPPAAFLSVPPGVFTGVKNTTIATWLKLSADLAWNRIFDFGGQGLGPDTRFMYLTTNTPITGMRFSTFGGVDTRKATVTTGTFLPLNVWKHVAVTAAEGGKHQIYIDGFPAAEATTVDVPPAELEPLSADSWLGKSRFPDPGLNGALDEFAVYDRVLTPAEIASLANPKADYTRLALDEASGTTSTDASTRGVNATLNGGATWASGRLGAAVQLSGTAQYLTLNNPIAGCTDELTVALWVKEAAASNWARILDFGGTNDNFMFLTPSNADGKLQLSIHTTAKETVVTSATTVPADSTWHHVAVVVSLAAATVYVDGAAVGFTLLPVTPGVLGATNENWLGKSRFPDPYFNGSFDEVRVSCRAFTADEIKNLAFH